MIKAILTVLKIKKSSLQKEIDFLNSLGARQREIQKKYGYLYR